MLDRAKVEMLLSGVSEPSALAAIDAAIMEKYPFGWIPSDVQRMAYDSLADLLLFGGAAGGGKTDLLCALASQAHYQATIYRRAYKDLLDIEKRFLEIVGGRDGFNGADHIWRGPDGKHTYFEALEKQGAEQSAQGRARDFIGFDEGAQLSRTKWQFVQGWLRSVKEGVRCRVVIASNPPLGGQGEWLIAEFAPWLDVAFGEKAGPGELRYCIALDDGSLLWLDKDWGETNGKAYVTLLPNGDYRLSTRAEIEEKESGVVRLDVVRPQSRTFVPAKLADNSAMDPQQRIEYMARLQAMPEPMRTKLIMGDFLAGKEDQEMQVIPTEWIERSMSAWDQKLVDAHRMTGMGVDIAQGGRDWTVIAPKHGKIFDKLKKKPGRECREPFQVAAFVVQNRRGRAGVTVDMGGGYGGATKGKLDEQGIPVTAFVPSGKSTDRTNPDGALGFINIRAASWWKLREDLDPSAGPIKVILPPDPALKAQLSAPTWKLKGTDIQVESKEDLKKRLGRSTDDADAVIMENFYGAIGELAVKMSAPGAESMNHQAPVEDPW